MSITLLQPAFDPLPLCLQLNYACLHPKDTALSTSQYWQYSSSDHKNWDHRKYECMIPFAQRSSDAACTSGAEFCYHSMQQFMPLQREACIFSVLDCCQHCCHTAVSLLLHCLYKIAPLVWRSHCKTSIN